MAHGVLLRGVPLERQCITVIGQEPDYQIINQSDNAGARGVNLGLG
jgi:hypothetical protein